MKILAIFFGVIFGIIIFLGCLTLYIFFKIKKIGRAYGFGNLKEFVHEANQNWESEQTRVKSISDMTRLVLPKLRDDFPNFNEIELFAKQEECLRLIFSALEKLDRTGLSKIPLLKDSIEDIIDDYKENGIRVRYDDVVFYKHAIKSYERKDGVATVSISSALSYYYQKTKNDTIIYDSRRHSKQTSYTTKFIYIYDLNKFKDYEKVVALNCPNCGAPVTDLGNKVCRYCKSGLDDLNLKAWLFSYYSEDY